MQVPGEGKCFITVSELVDSGFASRNSILRDIDQGIIPAIRIRPEGQKKSRIAIPRDELIEALERYRSPVRADADDAIEAVVS